MTLPAVSCVCLTYGRPHLLEEAIYSFLQQDYPGKKELIVLNDLAAQTLYFDHPEVKLFNFNKRFRTIGEKRNVSVALASHNIIFVWDDDDIHLPHRISFAMQQFQPQKAFFKPNRHYYWGIEGFNAIVNQVGFHGMSCWSRALFNQVGGYEAMDSGEDAEFEKQLNSQTTLISPITQAEIFYIYRWSVTNSYHLSAFDNKKTGEQIMNYVAHKLAQGEVTSGVIQLQPHWSIDYVKLVHNYLP